METYMWTALLAASVGLCWVALATAKEWKTKRLLQRGVAILRSKRNEDYVPLRLNQHNWAEFERSVPDLKQVIVVADMIQKPENSLEQAVLANFARRVRYSFVVSHSKAGASKRGFYAIFEALANLAIQKNELPLTPSDLVSIEALQDEWNGVPCVFYRTCESDAPNAKMSTIAFYGNKKNAGIADVYRLMDAPVADALATALVSGAPVPVQGMLQNFQADEYIAGEFAKTLATGGSLPAHRLN